MGYALPVKLVNYNKTPCSFFNKVKEQGIFHIEGNELFILSMV